MAGGGLKKESGAGALRGREEVALKVRQEAMAGAGGLDSSVAEGAFGGKAEQSRGAVRVRGEVRWWFDAKWVKGAAEFG